MNRTDESLTPEATIAELAQNVAGRHKHQRKTWFPAVPFMVVMALFTITVFCLAIIPTCVQVFTSASGSIDNLSSQIMKNVMLSVSFQLQQIMGSAKATMNTFGQFQTVRQLLSNSTESYGENLELIRTASTIILNSPVLVSLICVQNYNVTGRAPAVGQPVNSITAVYFDPALMWQYCDSRDTKNCYTRLYFPGNSSLDSPILAPFQTPENSKSGVLYQKLSSCGSPEGSWKPEVFQGFGFMSYAKCAAPNERGVVPYACGGAFSSSFQLPQMMATLAPTASSRVWLTSVDGKMISSNLNGTEYPLINERASDYVVATEFKDKTIQELSKKLAEGKKTWADINTFDVSTLFLNPTQQKVPTVEYILSNGSKWITIALVLTFGTPDRFYLMVSIPRDEFFGLVDSSIRNGITISSIIGVLGVIIGLGLTLFMVMPMQKLTTNMKSVTQFDFSMLQAGVLREDSVFSEVRHMQNTFNTMVKAFAGAIQVNKGLNNNKSSQLGATSGNGSYSYQVESRGGNEYIGMAKRF